ncbi:hypothetical protein MJ389_11155 [Escherichia coli]|nr:hypothetical protein MJ389_11155 [Escherichia coli]
MRTLWRFIAGFFKWTWRLLNFVREMVLNPILYFPRTGAGVYRHLDAGHGGDSKEHAASRALLLDISGVIVDKPSDSCKLSGLVNWPPAAWCQFRSSAGKLTV